MLDEDIAALAGVRLQKAKACLLSAEREMAVGSADSFKTSANRSYYAIFHAMRAVLAFDEFDSKKHSGVISAFRKDYVKTGIFPANLSDIVVQLENPQTIILNYKIWHIPNNTEHE